MLRKKLKKQKKDSSKEKYRKAIFLVIYRKRKNQIEYLLFKRKLHWRGWEFCKGGLENNETKLLAVKREAKEETGLKISNIKDHKVSGKYIYKNKLEDRPGIVGQTYHLFSAESLQRKVKIDKKEHSSHKWLNFEKAKEKLTHENQKKSLKIVNKWLIKNSKV